MVLMHRSSLRDLVDLEHGEISREVFVNEELYQQELEQVFARSWLFVGHESQVPKPGDFFQSRMGEEAVLLVRDRQGELHVFLNTCRHRGMKVCRYDQGNTLLFTCPFHGWSYDTNGKLVGVPEYDTAYHAELDKSRWGLPEARIANYHGSIWANWEPGAPSFIDWLGDYDTYFRTLWEGDDGRDGGVEIVGGVHKWRMPSNWKFPASSFGGDGAHGSITHRSINAAAIGPQGDREGGARHGIRPQWPSRFLEVLIPGLGHGCHANIAEPGAPYRETWHTQPDIEEYFREAHEKRMASLKERGMKDISAGAASEWPNVSFASGPRKTIVVWHPHGVQMTECWRFYMVDKNAPQAVKDALRRYHMRYSGPIGLTESDDMENWNYASAASNGTIARRYPYNYQMGMGHGYTEEGLPGELGPHRCEMNQRGRFARWLDLMEAESWDELYPKNRSARPTLGL
jgi:nitrite reductase/ring-hydroxylating ferredoxin subunit